MTSILKSWNYREAMIDYFKEFIPRDAGIGGRLFHNLRDGRHKQRLNWIAQL